MYGMYDMVADLLSNRNQTATQVYVHCQVDLFSEVGEAWMRAVRASLPRPEVIRQPLGGHQDADSANYVPYGRWDDVEIGALWLVNEFIEINQFIKVGRRGDRRAAPLRRAARGSPTPHSTATLPLPLQYPNPGMPLEQMDGAQYTLRRMPYVGLAIAAIVCIILGGLTRSS